MRMLVLLAAIMAVPNFVQAAQVNSSEYRQEHGFSGRSDGPYQRRDTYGFDMFVNGYRLNALTKAIYEDFSEYGDGDAGCMQSDWTACSTGAEVNLISFGSGNRAYVLNIVGQTVVGGVDMDAGSLDISGDQTDNDGLQIGFGMYGASGAPFIVGEDPAFYTCAKLTVADVSGADELWVGFRNLEVANATWNSHATYAVIGSLAGDVTIESELGGASAASTDTTENLADGGTDTYCVYVSSAGVVTYTIDGHAPATTAAVTITDATSLIPMIHVLQAATLSEEIDLLEWEVGYQ